MKLLDSFLHAVPTPFQGLGDYRSTLAGFLASAFLFQAEHAQRAILHATGETPPGQSATTDVHGRSGTVVHTPSYPLDGRLPGVWVALVLLSTGLSSVLLAEQEDNDNGGARADPRIVTSSHDIVSASRSLAGTGFVEELLGM